MSFARWKNRARPLLDLAAGLSARFSLRFNSAKVPVVSYAWIAPKLAEKSGGGAVKLAYLAQKYPENPRCNLLYLVSSALPKGDLGWAHAAKAKGIRVVLNQNGVAYPAWANTTEIARRNSRARELFAMADHIIYQSEFCRLSANQWVGKAPCESSLIYNPVDTDLFRPGISVPAKVELILAGSSSQPERVRIPLEALAIARRRGKQWRMRIGGRFLWPNAANDFNGWVAKFGLANCVEYVGPYTQEQAPRFYNGGRVLIHMQDKDASPTVPLEAMACGVPVVGIGTGGLPELVPENCGRLLPVRESWEKFNFPQPNEVFAAAEALLENPVTENCVEHVRQNFSLVGFLRQHDSLFAQLIH